MEFVFSYAWAAVVAVLIVRAVRQRGLLQVLAPASPTGDYAANVVIIIPMRDEAANIGDCLSSLVAQDYPRERVHILVVDDHSSDDSTAIVSQMAKDHPQITLMRSPPLPLGWTGKSHACWIGAQAAAGDGGWLCFMDADVRARPALISTAVQQVLRENLDLLSLAPRQDLLSFAERLVMPCGLFLLAFYQDLARAQAADSSEATATGQFMLIKRQSYDQAGGHAAVRSAICEDLELARLVKRSGGKVVLCGGERLIATRMYTGWRTLWPGLAKNVVDLLGGPLPTAFTALVGCTLAWSAVLIPGLEAARYAHGSPAASLPAALAGAATAAVVALHIAGTRYFRIPLWYGFLFPLGYTAGALIAFDSLRRRRRGQVTWKGRTYS